jgi:parvulin-like peptidyl-prolyl isomerase
MRNKIIFAVVTVLLSTATLAHAALDPNTVAVVNGKEISKKEFDRRYKENIQIFKFTPPTKASVLNDIINFELAVDEAKKKGLDKKPEIQERINAVLYQAVVEDELSQKFKNAVDVTEQEARSYCQKNPEIRTSHVYVPLKIAALKAEEEAAYKKIHEAEKALANGKKFESVVAQFSEGYATSAGGDIGFQTKDKLDPTYYKEAAKLPVGGVSKVVRSQFGLHIIKLTDKKSCDKVSIPEYQRMVYDEKRSKIFDDYLNGLRSKAKVSINNELVKE